MLDDDSLSLAIDSMASTHPLSSLVVVNNGRTARANLIKHFLRMLHHDELLAQKKCPLCYDALGPDQDTNSLKKHDKMAQHLYTCEMKNLEGHSERCHFCGIMVLSDELVDHLEACYLDVFPRLISQRYLFYHLLIYLTDDAL